MSEPVSRRCLALFGGGLDSQLAVRLMQLQGAVVSAVHFRSPWSEGTAEVRAAARAVNAPLTVVDQGDGYLERLRGPRFGYLAGAATCLDCRIAMLAAAREQMEVRGAEFVVTGEVVGQRVRSSVRDLEIVAHHAGLNDRLLRPLSARLLEPTVVEQQGWIDRWRLFDWQGKSRRPQERLASELCLPMQPPRPDCPLLAELAAVRAWKLIRSPDGVQGWELSLLAVGRQFELAGARAIVGRNHEENEQLIESARRSASTHATIISPANFFGPTALLIGDAGEANVQHAAALVARYSRSLPPEPRLVVEHAGVIWQVVLQSEP